MSLVYIRRLTWPDHFGASVLQLKYGILNFSTYHFRDKSDLITLTHVIDDLNTTNT